MKTASMSADLPAVRPDEPVPVAHFLDDGIRPALLALAIRNRQFVQAARQAKEAEEAGPPRGKGTGWCLACPAKISRTKALCLKCRQDLERRIAEEQAAKAAAEPTSAA